MGVPVPDRNQPGPHVRLSVFFTGVGDPRATFETLITRLRSLGQPAARRGWWERMLRARYAELAVIDEQDRAALARDARAFVHSVRQRTSASRQVAITATVFGTTRCVL